MPPLDLEHDELVMARELTERVESFEKSLGEAFRAKCDDRYREYRTFRRQKQDWIDARQVNGENDRDGVLIEAKRDWGANIHVPVAFNMIETMTPLAVAHRPRMLFLPRDPQGDANSVNVRLMVDAQQQAIDFDLELVDVAKTGFIYALGIGKTFWRQDWTLERKVKRTLRSLLQGKEEYRLGGVTRRLTFDDPDFISVDPYDFAWDEYGSSVKTSKWMGHRLWFGLDDCLDRIRRGVWNTPAAQKLDEATLRSMGSQTKHDEIWSTRMAESSFGPVQTRMTMGLAGGEQGEQIHEAWEIHTRERVLVLLDREVVVMDTEAPCPGWLPFDVFRPTPLHGQMVGISEIEPIQHLARELDILRSQRRDAVTLALCGGYAFDSSMVDEEDLMFGPAAAIEVRGDPRAALMPLTIKEPPGSSYQEELAVKGDIQEVSGLSDALAGQATQGTAPSTATEAQLVAATVTRRVSAKSRRIEAEVCRGAARKFLKLDQRNILRQRDVREMLPPDPEDPTVQRWRWWKLGPGELMGEFEVVPDGGVEARNVPEEMQRAQILMTSFNGSPFIDQRRLYMEVLRLMQVERPEAMLAPGVTPVPPEVFDTLVQMGVSRDAIEYAIQQAQQAHPQLPAPKERELPQEVTA